MLLNWGSFIRNVYSIFYFFVYYSCVAPTFSFEGNKEVPDLKLGELVFITFQLSCEYVLEFENTNINKIIQFF